ncbi:hypothetical protein ACFE04_015882 [Oxalis oulophora]
MSNISIAKEEENAYDDVYRVTFYGNEIETTVTSEADVVSWWISRIQNIHRYRLHRLVVGLDVEWRPSFSRYQNPVATLQLCVGRICLIFQILKAQEIPMSLSYFLNDTRFTFVGVGIGEDAAKLDNDYRLDVGRFVDLRHLAADRWGRNDVKSMGLAKLASMAMGIDFNGKPKHVTMGKWDNDWLTNDQVAFGCIDAFMSFETGRLLAAYQGIN